MFDELSFSVVMSLHLHVNSHLRCNWKKDAHASKIINLFEQLFKLLSIFDQTFHHFEI